ncbi:hypothetical protein ACSX1A_11965 [Pontibacter sp. MBLB2868]|uniref:hypothetical protein n=1 Tax=Pontibacter sp. MBLB2868 TaxID=3451555 RepID=UPI003F75615F
MSNRFKANPSNTFKDEIRFLQTHVPSALFGEHEVELSIDQRLLQHLITLIPQLYDVSDTLFGENIDSPTIRPIDIAAFLEQIKNKEALAYNIALELGVDFKIKTGSKSSDGLANLVAEFGRDAFGCYLPMHAFYNSPKTPWGIYLFPEIIAERARFLYKNKPCGLTPEEHYILYFYAVYRHEQFHFQTERFATKLEVGFKQAFYKPYREYVYKALRYSEHWLEEALAEGAVVDGILVSNRTKIDKSTIREIYQYDLQFMPPGYKDYHCNFYGGRPKAHQVFSSQIINANPDFYEKTTALVSVKGEFSADDRQVPVYIVTGLENQIRKINEQDFIRTA